jgi:hypothetical protein
MPRRRLSTPMNKNRTMAKDDHVHPKEPAMRVEKSSEKKRRRSRPLVINHGINLEHGHALQESTGRQRYSQSHSLRLLYWSTPKVGNSLVETISRFGRLILARYF